MKDEIKNSKTSSILIHFDEENASILTIIIIIIIIIIVHSSCVPKRIVEKRPSKTNTNINYIKHQKVNKKKYLKIISTVKNKSYYLKITT